MLQWRPKKRPAPKKKTEFSDDALGWIFTGLALVAAILLDKNSEPHNRWHAAIVWTVTAFLGLVVWFRLITRRKRRSLLAFWVFWLACLVVHVYAMRAIFGWLLPRLMIGTLFVGPIDRLKSSLSIVKTILCAGTVQVCSLG
jgi:FtsH-binding integral membrane protein